MSFNFPASPTLGQEYDTGTGLVYSWNGYGWIIKPMPLTLPDGDKGDILVSGGGLTWTLDSTVVTNAARTVLDDTTVAAMRTTIGAEPAIATGTTAQYWRGDKTWVTPPAQDWSVITNKPTTFPPSTHSHPQSEVTSLVTDLAGKEPTIAGGTTAQYWRGDKSWQTLPTTPTLPPSDGAEYVMVNGVWREKSRTFDLNGLSTLDITVPTHARFVGINASIFAPSGISIGLQVSLDGTTFYTGATQYQLAGGPFHNNNPALYSTQPAAATSMLTLGFGSTNTNLPHLIDATMALDVPVAPQLLALSSREQAFNNTGAVWTSTWLSYLNTAVSPGRVKKLRVFSGSLVNGSWLTVEWK